MKTPDVPLYSNKVEQLIVSYKIAKKLKAIGFNEPTIFAYDSFTKIRCKISHSSDGDFISWDRHDNHLKAPTINEAFKWFRDVWGFYVVNQPEFYTTGINFNWQILWYLPRDKWKIDNKGRPFLIEDGTFMYGDNAEYPTQELADIAIVEKMIELAQKEMKKDV